ncbi:MAG: hypothetical protein RLY93_00110 [Sumerlaeia bacterium]
MELCPIDWLPEPDVIMARSKAAAAADLLLSDDPDFRQYHFVERWKDGISLAWRHDGGGSYYYILRSGDTIAIKVCALRLSMSPDMLCRFQRQPTVPMPELAVRLLNEPELRYQEMSFLAWSEGGQPWQSLAFRVDNKTSEEMGKPFLDLICVGPKSFYIHAMNYHEVKPDPPALKAIFQLTPLDAALAETLAPGVKLGKVRAELGAIGYPMG